MRLTLAYTLATTSGLLSSGFANAFVPPFNVGKRLRIPRRGMVQSGWDNDDFLNALSGSSNDMEEANRDYERQSRHQPSEEPGADSKDTGFTPEERHEQGGSRFKEMMRLAQDPDRVMGRQPPQYAPPPQYTPPPQQAQQAVAPNPADLENMSTEDQARMFREMMAQQQQQQQPQQQFYPPQQPQPPAPQYLPGGVDAQGRKIGRNKDADAIANSSDLYFAQLKRDSTVRTRARYAGDVEKANAAMQDSSVSQIEDQLKKNPYLTAQQERARTFVEGTSDEEMLVVVPPETKTQQPDSYSGVNFRKKFEEVKRKRTGEQTTAASSTAAPSQQPVQDEEVPVVRSEPREAVSPPEQPFFVASASSKVAPSRPPVKEEDPIVREDSAHEAASPEETPFFENVVTSPAAKGHTSEETRRLIRTYMGLMLKHRGGPGFGSGRLKLQEAQRFETMLNEITDMLRSEAGMPPKDRTLLQPIWEMIAAARESEQQPRSTAPMPTSPVSEMEQPPIRAQPTTPAKTEVDPLSGTIACVEGAVAMYKSGGASNADDNMVSLRTALMGAVNSCNKAIAERQVAEASEQTAGSSTMEFPTELQEPAAPTMEFPSEFHEPAATTMNFPAEFQKQPAPTMEFSEGYDDEQPDEPLTVQGAPFDALSNGDANTELLHNIYNSLKASAGGARLGLKEGMTEEEARSLADHLTEMRGVLMEELESGIPDPSEETATREPTTANSTAGDGSGSKYQQMLARAKKAKEG